MMRTCTTCGKSFTPRREWERRCYACWRAERNELQALRAENDTLRREFARLKSETTPDGFAEHLPRLLQLAHPDRHNGSIASTTATAWLLKQRDALRRAGSC
jgi:hypothetical protein